MEGSGGEYILTCYLPRGSEGYKVIKGNLGPLSGESAGGASDGCRGVYLVAGCSME